MKYPETLKTHKSTIRSHNKQLIISQWPIDLSCLLFLQVEQRNAKPELTDNSCCFVMDNRLTKRQVKPHDQIKHTYKYMYVQTNA